MVSTGPWCLLSPRRVLHYVTDLKALKELAFDEGIDDQHFQRLVGVMEDVRVTHGAVRAKHVKVRFGWQLLSQVQWLKREDSPDDAVFVGGDLSFFMTNVAMARQDMFFFKQERLRMFLDGQLFNSGNKVTIYTTKGKTAPRWRLVDAPANALELIPHVPLPSPFAPPAEGIGAQLQTPLRAATTAHADAAAAADGDILAPAALGPTAPTQVRSQSA